MNDLITVPFESIIQSTLIRKHFCISRNRVNACTHLFQFFPLGENAVFSEIKVKLDFVMVYVTVIIHYYCFYPAAVHTVQYMRYPNRLFHLQNSPEFS